jgi:hypothetical protein
MFQTHERISTYSSTVAVPAAAAAEEEAERNTNSGKHGSQKK